MIATFTGGCFLLSAFSFFPVVISTYFMCMCSINAYEINLQTNAVALPLRDKGIKPGADRNLRTSHTNQD